MALANSLRSGSSAKSGRIGQDRLQFLFQAGFVSTREDEFADEIGCPPGGFTQRDAETNKIFSVHNRLSSCSLLPRSHVYKLFHSASCWRSLFLLEDKEAPGSERPCDVLTP